MGGGGGSSLELARLRADYLQTSHRRLCALRDELEGAGPGDAALLERVRTQAHRFRGSGASYGFPEVTEAADALEAHLEAHPAEALLRPGPERERLHALLSALIASFEAP